MANKTEIRLTCGDCLYYTDMIHPCENLTCKLAGYLSYSSPCSNFCYNTKNLTIINNQDKEFYSFIRKVPQSKLTELAALLVQEGYNRMKGWSLGDLAYFNLGKSDYISSYVQVVFKGLTDRSDNMALIEGSKQNEKLWLGEIELGALLNTKQWREKHKSLLAEGKILDEEAMKNLIPNYTYPSIEEMKKEDYTPTNVIDYMKMYGIKY